MNHRYSLKIQRSNRRKNPTIEVQAGSVVKVIVPENYHQPEIDTLLKSKANWIVEKLKIVKDITPPRVREYVSGESFPMLGKNYRLKVVKGHKSPTRREGDKIIASSDNGDRRQIEDEIMRFYKLVAKEKLTERVRFYAKKLVVEPTGVKIGSFKRQWGSCSPSGVVSFNWQIVAAPNSIVDYVVVHELCHLEHPNHSRDFWKLVSTVMPNYRDLEESLSRMHPLFEVG